MEVAAEAQRAVEAHTINNDGHERIKRLARWLADATVARCATAGVKLLVEHHRGDRQVTFREDFQDKHVAAFNLTVLIQLEAAPEGFAPKLSFIDAKGRITAWNRLTDVVALVEAGWRIAVENDQAALMTLREFEELPEYSTSIPSGTTAGKRWRRRVAAGRWQVGEYFDLPADDPRAGKEIGIRWRVIRVEG